MLVNSDPGENSRARKERQPYPFTFIIVDLNLFWYCLLICYDTVLHVGNPGLSLDVGTCTCTCTLSHVVGWSRVRAPAVPNKGVTIGTGCFLAKSSTLSGYNQDWLTRCQDNVTGWYICFLCLRHGASVLCLGRTVTDDDPGLERTKRRRKIHGGPTIRELLRLRRG